MQINSMVIEPLKKEKVQKKQQETKTNSVKAAMPNKASCVFNSYAAKKKTRRGCMLGRDEQQDVTRKPYLRVAQNILTC